MKFLYNSRITGSLPFSYILHFVIRLVEIILAESFKKLQYIFIISTREKRLQWLTPSIGFKSFSISFGTLAYICEISKSNRLRHGTFLVALPRNRGNEVGEVADERNCQLSRNRKIVMLGVKTSIDQQFYIRALKIARPRLPDMADARWSTRGVKIWVTPASTASASLTEKRWDRGKGPDPVGTLSPP